jgi:DNA-binding winged helix-turn-helix (wHTH) protein
VSETVIETTVRDSGERRELYPGPSSRGEASAEFPKDLRLRRKPFAILRYLAEHPQRLVSQEELVKEIWGNIVVSESAIRTQLYDLRQAVGEGVIETVVGRGYRFLPAVTTGAEISAEPAGGPVARQGGVAHSPAATPSAARAGVAAPAPVGRGDELQALSLAVARAAAGERQMVFVTGEPGIGKSTLVNAFLSELPADRVLAIRGQCVEQSGHGEPYLPLLEGLRRLCEAPGGEAAWFTEGFSGADLVEAKQLLDKARQQRPQARRRRA